MTNNETETKAASVVIVVNTNCMSLSLSLLLSFQFLKLSPLVRAITEKLIVSLSASVSLSAPLISGRDMRPQRKRKM